MMKKVSWRIAGIMSPLTIACSLLVSGSLAWADTGDGPCSNRTLRGDYGFAIEGLILPAPGVAVPIRGVNMTHYDGEGGSSQVDHIVSNGVPISPIDWTPTTGTYHVNADCTGTAQIDQVGGDLLEKRCLPAATPAEQDYVVGIIVVLVIDPPPRSSVHVT